MSCHVNHAVTCCDHVMPTAVTATKYDWSVVRLVDRQNLQAADAARLADLQRRCGWLSSAGFHRHEVGCQHSWNPYEPTFSYSKSEFANGLAHVFADLIDFCVCSTLFTIIAISSNPQLFQSPIRRHCWISNLKLGPCLQRF